MFQSALAVTLFSFLTTAINFLFNIYLAGRFGTAQDMDAFIASTTLPVFINMVFVGTLAFPLLVNLVDTRERSEEREAWVVFTTILLLMGAVSISITGGLAIWADELMRFTTPGLNPGVSALSARLLRMQSPVVVLSSLAVVIGAWQNSALNFVLPAVAQVMGVVTSLIVVVSTAPFFGIEAVALGSVTGALLQLLMLLPALGGTAQFIRKPNFGHPAVRRILSATVPLIVGAAYVKTDAAVDRYIASSLPSGNISQLAYAWRLTLVLSGIAATGLATTSLSVMAGQAAVGESGELRTTFAGVVRMLVFVIAPIATLVMLAGPNLVSLVFLRGRFTFQDSRMVGRAMACYVGLLLGQPLSQHLSNAFYTMHDTKTPTLCIVGAYTLGIPLKFVLVPHFGILGLAAATSLYYFIHTAALGVLLAKRLDCGFDVRVRRFATKMASCLGCMAVSVLLVKSSLIVGTVSPACVGLVCTGVGGAIYVSAALTAGLPEPRMWVDVALNKLGRARA